MTASSRYCATAASALVHASLGEREQAYEWLAKARDKARTSPEAANMLKADPRLDPLRADPKYRDIFVS